MPPSREAVAEHGSNGWASCHLNEKKQDPEVGIACLGWSSAGRGNVISGGIGVRRVRPYFEREAVGHYAGYPTDLVSRGRITISEQRPYASFGGALACSIVVKDREDCFL